MSKIVKKRSGKTVKKFTESPFKIYWDKKNYLFLALGIALSVVGYYLLSISPWDNPAALVVSPIILFIVYIVIFPLSIFYKSKSASKSSVEG